MPISFVTESGALLKLTLASLTLIVASPNGQAKGDGPPAEKKVAEKPKLSPMEQCWADLQKSELPAARALLKMTDTPKESVEFLKGKLKPLKIDPESVTALLEKLDNEDEATWKEAFEELDYFDPRLAIDLETLMENVTTKPLRQRLVEILSERKPGSLADQEITLRNTGGDDNFNFSSGNGSWWAEVKISRIGGSNWRPKRKWARASRAIALLEHIKTPEAIAILKDMTTGHPEAAPTIAAVNAMKRIEGKPVPEDTKDQDNP